LRCAFPSRNAFYPIAGWKVAHCLQLASITLAVVELGSVGRITRHSYEARIWAIWAHSLVLGKFHLSAEAPPVNPHYRRSQAVQNCEITTRSPRTKVLSEHSLAKRHDKLLGAIRGRLTVLPRLFLAASGRSRSHAAIVPPESAAEPRRASGLASTLSWDRLRGAPAKALLLVSLATTCSEWRRSSR
jgi:hypothetical protein